jgi:3-oxoacyl-[acyl-carrier protein] reductase
MTALVTGASRGIGRAIALRLAADGMLVIRVSRTEGEFPCDVADAAQLRATLAQLDRRIGAIDILINNAAYGGPLHDVEATDDDEWERYLATNITAPFRLCRHYLPRMKAQGFGRIVNIASVLGLVGAPQSAAYAAMKHALVGLTRSLALEAAPFGVTVNALCPGYIETEMTRARPPVPAGRMGTPEEVAEFTAMLCRRESGYINGAALTIDGALLAGLNPQ